MLKAIREWWTGRYESRQSIVIGQPFGPSTTASCSCGGILSNRKEDWMRVEATRQFETTCPNCGPVRVGAW